MRIKILFFITGLILLITSIFFGITPSLITGQFIFGFQNTQIAISSLVAITGIILIMLNVTYKETPKYDSFRKVSLRLLDKIARYDVDTSIPLVLWGGLQRIYAEMQKSNLSLEDKKYFAATLTKFADYIERVFSDKYGHGILENIAHYEGTEKGIDLTLEDNKTLYDKLPDIDSVKHYLERIKARHRGPTRRLVDKFENFTPESVDNIAANLPEAYREALKELTTSRKKIYYKDSPYHPHIPGTMWKNSIASMAKTNEGRVPQGSKIAFIELEKLVSKVFNDGDFREIMKDIRR